MALFSACAGGSAIPFCLGLGVATCSCSLCTGLVLVTCGDSLCSPLSAPPSQLISSSSKSLASRNAAFSDRAALGSSSFGGSDLVVSAYQPWTADQYAAYLAHNAPSTSRMTRRAADDQFHSLHSDSLSRSLLERSPGSLNSHFHSVSLSRSLLERTSGSLNSNSLSSHSHSHSHSDSHAQRSPGAAACYSSSHSSSPSQLSPSFRASPLQAPSLQASLLSSRQFRSLSSS